MACFIAFRFGVYAEICVRGIAVKTKLPDSAMSDEYDKRQKLMSLHEPSKWLEALKINDKAEEKEPEKQWKKDVNSSTNKKGTLSLHITAYEKSNEAAAAACDPFGGNNKEYLKNNFSGSIKNEKHFLSSAFIIQNPFEFPRQKNDRMPSPEVTEYKVFPFLSNVNEASNNGQQSINLVQQQQLPQNSDVLQQQSPHSSTVGMQQYPHIKSELEDSFSELSSGIGTSEIVSQPFGAHSKRKNQSVKSVAAASSQRSRTVLFKVPLKTSATSRSRTIQRVKSVAAASSQRSRTVSIKVPLKTSATSRTRTVQRVKPVAADSTPRSSQPFGDDLTNSRKRSRTVNYRFFDGTVHHGAIFTGNKKRCPANENNDEVQGNRGKKRTHDVKGGRTAASREHGTIPVLVDMQKEIEQRSRTVNPANSAAINLSQRSRTVKIIVPESSIPLRDTGSTPPSRKIQRVAADSTPRSRSISFKVPLTTSATSRSRTVGSASASRERQRTRGRPNKDEIKYDCEIEGVEKFFKVCRRLLCEKSVGFKTLFDANKEDKIVIDDIRDQTLELAISFCHGKPLKDLNNTDLFSLLFFADTWEMPELKKALEGQMLKKLKPYNVVIHANAALMSNSDVVKTACKDMMLEQMTNGEAVRNYVKLNERFRAELNELQNNMHEP